MHTVTSWLDRTCQAMLVLLVALLPVAFIPVSWATLPHAKIGLIALCAGIGIALYVAARFLDGAFSAPKSWIVLASILLPFMYTVSALWAGGGRASFLGAGVEPDTVATVFLWTAMLLLAAFVFRTRPQLMRLQQVLILGAGLVVLFHIARLIVGASNLAFGGIFVDPAASLVGSWHDLAIFLGLVTFLAITFLATRNQYTNGIFTWVARGIAACSVGLLIVINMNDVWIALAVLSVSGLSYFLVSGRGDDQTAYAAFLRWGVPLALVLMAALVFSYFGKNIHDMLPPPVRIEHVEVRPSWGGTIEVAAHMLGANSILGSGPNTFMRQWGLYKPAGVNETAFWNADFSQGVGLIPTSLITVGILGLLAWLFFLFATLYEGTRIVLKSARDVRPVVFSLGAGAAYLWVFAMIYHPGVSLIAVAFLLTGALVGWGMHTGAIGAYPMTTRNTHWKGFALSVALVVIALLFLGVSALVLRTIVSDMFVNRGIAIYNTSQDIARAEASVTKALAIDGSNERALRAALELGILQVAKLAASKDSNAAALRDELTKTITAAIQHGLAAVSVDSDDYQNWVALARVYEQLVGAQVGGAYQNAEQAYKNAIEKNPTNPLFQLRLAQLAIAQNDAKKAEQYLIEAIKLKPNFAAALFLASQVAASLGDLQGALVTAHAAVQAAPEEPVAWFQFGVLLFQAGKNDEARQALEKAVTLNANYANAIYVLGLVYDALGRKDDALRAMKRVLELNPGNTQVEDAIAHMEKGTPTPPVKKKRK